MRISTLPILLGAFLFVAITTPCSAQPVPTLDFSTLLRHNGNARTAELDSAGLSQLEASRMTIENFPIGDGEVGTINVERRKSAIDRGTTILVGSELLHGFSGVLYEGAVVGEPTSRVIMSISNGYLFCSIERDGLSPFMICPARHSSDHRLHYFMTQGDLLSMDSAREPFCINEDEPDLATEPTLHRDPTIMHVSSLTHDLLQCDVAVEADSDFYADAGGRTDLVVSYVDALFSMASAIYEDEAQITFHIPWLKLWPSGDPYNVNGNAYALPDTVRSYWKLHYDTVARDVAHVMTSLSNGGGGFGWFAMCSKDYGYSVSSPRTHEPFPTFAFTYDAYIVSHEIGHNFGLPHSENCYWDPPMDTCFTNDDPKLKLGDACYGLPITPRPNPGTIMSYCANANYALSGNDYSQFKLRMTFSPRGADTLRMKAETYPCITEPPNASLRLLSPRGGYTLPGDTTMDITWTYAHVTTVTLEYSLDSMRTWSVISPAQPATLGTYSWTVPNISTPAAFVRIVDVDSSLVGDTSLMSFAVAETQAVEDAATVAPVSLITTARGLTITSAAPATVDIFDVLGRMIRAAQINAGTSSLDLEQLSRGTYIVRVQTKTETRSYRIQR